MKKFIYLLILVSFFPIFAQEEMNDTQDQNNSDITDDNTKHIQKLYQIDTETVLQLLENIRNYNVNSKDTTVQKDLKEKKHQEILLSINKKYSGKQIHFQRTRLIDVEPEKELSKYGEKKAKELILQLKQDPTSAAFLGDGDVKNNPFLTLIIGFNLGFCNQCWRETGRYIAKYNIPVPDDDYSDGIDVGLNEYGSQKTLSVKIEKIFPSAESVLMLQKGSIGPLSGVIRTILHKDSLFESVEIVLF